MLSEPSELFALRFAQGVENDIDFARLVKAWSTLPEPIRRAVTAWKDLPEPARQALVSAAKLALAVLEPGLSGTANPSTYREKQP